jgi:PhnB protein
MIVNPYLNFNGRCEEALEFYREAIGAQIEMVMRNNQSPDEPPPGMLPPNSGNKIMHSSFRVGDTVIMATDGGCGGEGKFEGVSLAVSVKTEAEADRIFNGLASGGQVRMPLTKTFFSPRFGMLADKFGLGWMIVTQSPHGPQA